MKDLFLDLLNGSKKHFCLYHYTSIDSLEIILKNQSMRLSCLTKVNDPEENKRITSLWNSKVFVACFTHTLDNETYFFQNYGHIRITFYNDLDVNDIYFDTTQKDKLLSFKKDLNEHSITTKCDYNLQSSWCLFDSCLSDVYYTDNINLHVADENNESNAGLIKSRHGVNVSGNKCDWSMEEETRLRVAIRPISFECVLNNRNCFEYPKPPFEYLYFSIANKIKNIEISPNASPHEVSKFNDIKRLFSI